MKSEQDNEQNIESVSQPENNESPILIDRSEPTGAPPVEKNPKNKFLKKPKSLKLPFIKSFSKGQQLIVVVGLLLIVGVLGYFWLNPGASKEQSVNNTTTDQVKLLGAEVLLLEGDAEISKDGQKWEPLKQASPVTQGDYIKTLTDGRLVIAFDDGSAIRLNKDSGIYIRQQNVEGIDVENQKGEVYARVVPSDSRLFSVGVKEQSYIAKGTAYKTINKDDQKGVEVYHSKVATKINTKEITEGKKLFTTTPQKDQQDVVLDINIDDLKKDEFVAWCVDQDKKDKDFATALGILDKLDDPVQEAPVVAPAPAKPNGIFLSGKAVEYSATFSWSVRGVDVSQGYKLLKSSKTASPTYPENSAAFVEAGKSSYSLSLGDGVTYYFRLCAYRPSSKTCDSYSNTVTVTTANKPKEQVVLGGVTLAINSNLASWTIGGTAPYGYKLFVSASPTTPSIENHIVKKGVSSTSYELTSLALASGSYNVRVCKYNYDGSCAEYSNQVSYIIP